MAVLGPDPDTARPPPQRIGPRRHLPLAVIRRLRDLRRPIVQHPPHPARLPPPPYRLRRRRRRLPGIGVPDPALQRPLDRVRHRRRIRRPHRPFRAQQPVRQDDPAGWRLAACGSWPDHRVTPDLPAVSTGGSQRAAADAPSPSEFRRAVSMVAPFGQAASHRSQAAGLRRLCKPPRRQLEPLRLVPEACRPIRRRQGVDEIIRPVAGARRQPDHVRDRRELPRGGVGERRPPPEGILHRMGLLRWLAARGLRPATNDQETPSCVERQDGKGRCAVATSSHVEPFAPHSHPAARRRSLTASREFPSPARTAATQTSTAARHSCR